MDNRILDMLDQLVKSQDTLAFRLGQIERKLEGTKPEKEWYTPEEVATALHRKAFTVREWCRLGRIKSEKDRYTGKRRIHVSELERLRGGGGLHPPLEHAV